MPKIVINRCYGGYRLSHRAVEFLAERKGLATVEHHDFLYLVSSEGEELDPIYDIARDDPDLVAVVESLGSEAHGPYSDLKVVEVPDDINWYIDEYDGAEHVAERHRTWS